MDNNLDEDLKKLQENLRKLSGAGQSIKSSNSSEEELQKLNGLIGLEDVKEEVNKLTNYLKFSKKVESMINLDVLNLNMVFKGNPGTGKTTVARILANILYNLGFLTSNNVVETTPTDFIAGYVGQTGIKAKKLIDNNQGGVIFIDEAYGFSQGKDENSHSFAAEAINEIIKEMEKKRTVFIFAGYDNEMEEFIDMNPGIRSRVGYTISFKNYSLDDLVNMFIKKIGDAGFSIYDDALDSVRDIIKSKMEEKNFGNGRMIDNLYNKILIEHASLNFMEDDQERLLTISNDSVSNISFGKEVRGVYFG